MGSGSSSAAVIVSGGAIPTIDITSPLDGEVLVAGRETVLRSTLTGSAGVSNVEYFLNAASLGVATEPPYELSFTPVSSGEFVLYAVATSSGGVAVTSEPTTLQVQSNTAPTIAITAPTTGDVFSADETIVITASVTDSFDAITQVEYFANNVSIGVVSESPFSLDWIAPSTGSFDITAIATDSSGDRGFASTVSLTIDPSTAPTTPTVVVTNPTAGLTFPVGETIPLTASVTTSGSASADSITVDFFVNDVFLGTATEFPYQFDWQPISNGIFTITARGTELGSTAGPVSSGVSVTVGTVSTPDAPSVVLITPPSGSTVALNEPTRLSASASAISGGALTVIYTVDSTEVGRSTEFPYYIDWTPSVEGDETIEVEVTEMGEPNAGTISIPVIVSGGVVPGVEVTSPFNGEVLVAGRESILRSQLTDVTGSVSVEYFLNTASLGIATEPPYEVGFTPVSSGEFVLYAVATSSGGVAVTSEPTTLQVQSNTAPTIAITAPTTGDVFSADETIVITASVTDSFDAITQVEYFANNVSIGVVSESPFSLDWIAPSTGSFDITAIATDSSGDRGFASTVSLTIDPSTAPTTPTVVVTNPTAGLTFPVGETIPLTASVTTSGSASADSITVDFFVNDVFFGNGY